MTLIISSLEGAGLIIFLISLECEYEVPNEICIAANSLIVGIRSSSKMIENCESSNAMLFLHTADQSAMSNYIIKSEYWNYLSTSKTRSTQIDYHKYGAMR